MKISEQRQGWVSYFNLKRKTILTNRSPSIQVDLAAKAIAGNNMKSLLRQYLPVGTAHPTGATRLGLQF